MQHTLELLAPARNLSIGIAAINCGADAVYIAGPAFGARQAAGNSVDDIRELCRYAHRFGARIYVTVNTILYNDELEEARALVRALVGAGADALIVQDPALTDLCKDLPIPLHASTQCSIRTPERAAFLEGLGFSRVVPERQLSLDEIRAIREAIAGEIECFVHGALCVCYSGQCYLSEYLTGRSANRGACAQPCRSRYDLCDRDGKLLVRNKALLSLRDFQLLHRLEDLAEAGACSFKIEGRLKSISYVRNVVRAYSMALDALIAKAPEKYVRASFGRITDAFSPDLEKTFQRGYTELYLDGRRGRNWSSADAPKSIGERVGTVRTVRGARIELDLLPSVRLCNGDGFAFVGDGDIIGFRGDVCEGRTIRCSQPVDGLKAGMALYRNVSVEFEKGMEQRSGKRLLETSLTLDVLPDALRVTARSEDGRSSTADFSTAGCPEAQNQERMREMAVGQLSKTSGAYAFRVAATGGHPLPLLKASFLNDIRRKMAERLDAMPCGQRPLCQGKQTPRQAPDSSISYKENVSNHLSRAVYERLGATSVEPAYELAHQPGAELMRSRYCIRYELGMCPKYQGAGDSGPLFLLNNGRRLALGFDCRRCEMTVSEAIPAKK